MKRKNSFFIAFSLILLLVMYVPSAYVQSAHALELNANGEQSYAINNYEFWESNNLKNYDGFLVVTRNNVFVREVDLINALVMNNVESGILGLSTLGYTTRDIEKVSDDVYKIDCIEDALKLYNMGLVTSVEPNYYLEVQGKSDYQTNWWSTRVVGADSAWNHLDENGNNDMLGDDVIVGVIDTGVYREHSDFNINNMLESQNPANATNAIDSNHGTFVAGVIAGQLNNGNNVDGIAPNVKIQPICVQANGSISLSNIVSGIDYCINNNVDVINISIGGDNYMPSLEEACVKAEKAGIIVVVSAGNYKAGKAKSNKTYMYPASSEGVISVSASAEKDGEIIPSDFTYFNDKVDFSAPGTDIRSLKMDGSIGTDSGTSYSSPLVAGMAALAKQKNEAINREIFVEILKATSDDKGDAGKDDYFGYGHVNITKFVEMINNEYVINYSETDGTPVDGITSGTYEISSPEIILPIPTKKDYDFVGWYDNKDFLGKKIEKIPTASFGDKTFYAKWIMNKRIEIDAIEVEDKETGYKYKAERTTGIDSFIVTMPANSTYNKDSIKIIGAVEGSNCIIQGDEITGIYSINMSSDEGSTMYSLTITNSAISAPTIVSEIINGTATPKSLDGKINVVEFKADLSKAFITSGSAISAYEIISGVGTLSGNIISYSPTQADEGKKLEIKVRASNEEDFRSKIVTYSVAVGQVPISNSVIKELSYSVNLNTNKKDLAFNIINYNNKITSVTLNEDIIQWEVIYNEASIAEKEVTSILILRHDTIRDLATGVYTLKINFDRGEPLSVTINIIEIEKDPEESNPVEPEPEEPNPKEPDPIQPGTNPGGGSGGGVGGGTSGNTPEQIETIENSDGSITVKETKKDGTVVETTKGLDGSITVKETKKDGTVVTKIDDGKGNTSVKIEYSNGYSSEEIKKANGTIITIENTPSGDRTITEITEDGIKVETKITEDEITSKVSFENLLVGESKIVNIPVENLELGAVAIIVDPDGTEIVVKKSAITEEGLSVMLSEDCTLKIVNRSKKFEDVSSDNWAKASIDFVVSRELFKGISESEFGINKPMTRAMLFTTIARLEDVNTEGGATWYELGMNWAKEKGVSDGSNPNSNITREQLVTMLYRLSGEPESKGNIGMFTDSNKVSDYAKKALAWAVEKGIINGNPDGSVKPHGNATRAQVATMLERYIMQLVNDKY